MEPPDELKAMDPHSVEAIDWGLWCTLQCICTKCDTEVDLPFWDNPPWSGDICTWAKHFAPQIVAAGWRLDADGFNLLPRRFTRLTNAHSKSLRHHKAMQAIFVAWFNNCRKHEII